MASYQELFERAQQTAAELVPCAARASLTVCTAESCTAGLVTATIADVAGASDVLRGGAVTYVNEIKHEMLGVRQDTLDHEGAVSRSCASQMASGTRARFSSDIGVSVTGFAGPGGGTAEEPVGTVYLGISSARGTQVERHVFPGDRACVRMAACARALEMLLEEVQAIAESR